MKIRVFEAFAGYGSQSLALERLKRHFPEFDYEVVGISEIDRYAVTAYKALHGDVPNYGDISKIDWNKVPDFDLFTYSFPCTNLSNAGRQEGCEEGSGTASSLLWECRKAIVAKRPRYLLMENVKALVSLKFLPYFLKWQSELVSYGYSNFARVLNAKDFGVPQNRERIFMVSILDRQATYHFPEPFPLDRRIKDILEEDVDERYFLSEKLVDYVFSNGGKAGDIKGATGVHEPDDDIAGTVTAQYWKTPRQGNYIKYPSDKTICLNSKFDGKQPSLEHRAYDSDGISTATTTGFMPSILTPKRNEYGKSVRKEYESGKLDESRHKMTDLEPRTLEFYKKRNGNIKIGRKYGRLTVIEKTNKKQGTNSIYKCKCDCGNIVYVSSGHLGKETFSCGCLKKECHTTHGMSKSRIYNIWTLMKRRCNNEFSSTYNRYGGRGIKICKEWNDDFESFLAWSLKNGYSDNLTIDRINNDGDYEPGNCRWTDLTTQVNNRGVWGEIPYYGIVKDNTGYRAQVTVNGKKIYIGHSKDDINLLIEMRNKFIDEHNLKCKKNIIPVDYHVPLLCPTKDTMGGGNLEPKIIIGSAQKNAYVGSVDGPSPCINAACGMGGGQTPMIVQTARGFNKGGLHEVSPTISANSWECNNFLKEDDFKIRKLTPRECLRLMNVDDADIDKMFCAGLSNTQLYKMAGNSIVVNVLYHIFRKMFVEKENENEQLTIF